jgi:MFS family permease
VKSRNSLCYVGGTLISTFGDKVLFIAAAIWVRVLTGSNADAGLTIFFYIIPGVVVGPIAGVVADRFPRRIVLLVCDAASAVALLALLGIHGQAGLWRIYLVMTIYGALATVGSAAGVGLRTTIFGDSQIAGVNGLLSTVSEGMRLVVPLIGAGLFVVAGAMAVAWVDIGSFCVAVVLLSGIKVVEQHEANHGTPWVTLMTAGVHYIFANPLLRRLTVGLAVCVSTFGFFETAMFAVTTNGLGRSASFVGVFMALQGVGAIVAGISSARLISRFGEMKLSSVGMVVIALGSAMILLATHAHSWLSVGVDVASVGILGVGVTWLLVANTAIRRSTPRRLMGRVDAVFSIIFSGLQGLSVAIGAGFVALVGFRIPILLIIVTALIGAVALGYRAIVFEPPSPELDAG